MPPKKEFLLRIDPALWNELHAWAADELRSVNGQIEYILRNALTKRRGNKETTGSDEQENSQATNDEPN